MNLNQTDIDVIWESYNRTKDDADRQKIIVHYLWLVKYAVKNMSLPINSILEEQDFISVGIIGLNDAIEKFDISRGFKFESYAIKRVKGIIRDEMRRVDWLSRSTRKKAQDFLQISDKLQSGDGYSVSNEEIRKKLNVSPEKYESYLQAAAAAKATLSLRDSTLNFILLDNEQVNILDEYPDEDNDFIEEINIQERRKFILEFINSLKENKRIILTLYYFENLTFREIGQVLNISESRVSQIHTQLLADLKKTLEEFRYA